MPDLWNFGPGGVAMGSFSMWHVFVVYLIWLSAAALGVFVTQLFGLQIRTGVLAGSARGGWCLTNRAHMQSDGVELPTIAELRSALGRDRPLTAVRPHAPKFADVYAPKPAARAEVVAARVLACGTGLLLAFCVHGVPAPAIEVARPALAIVLVLAADAPLYLTRRERMQLRSPTFAQLARAASDRCTVPEFGAGVLMNAAATMYVMCSALSIASREHPLTAALQRGMGTAAAEYIVLGVRVLACVIAVALGFAAARARHWEMVAVLPLRVGLGVFNEAYLAWPSLRIACPARTITMLMVVVVGCLAFSAETFAFVLFHLALHVPRSLHVFTWYLKTSQRLQRGLPPMGDDDEAPIYRAEEEIAGITPDTARQLAIQGCLRREPDHASLDVVLACCPRRAKQR